AAPPASSRTARPIRSAFGSARRFLAAGGGGPAPSLVTGSSITPVGESAPGATPGGGAGAAPAAPAISVGGIAAVAPMAAAPARAVGGAASAAGESSESVVGGAASPSESVV